MSTPVRSQFEYAIAVPIALDGGRRWVRPNKPEPPRHLHGRSRDSHAARPHPPASSSDPLEIVVTDTRTSPIKLCGYAAVWDALSEPFGDGHREKIAAGAFTESLEMRNIPFLFLHNPVLKYGDTASGRLQLRQDPRGLWFTVEVPDCDRRLLDRIRDRRIAHMSFGYKVIGDAWRNGVRVLRKVAIDEISAVQTPRWPQTWIDIAKSAAERSREADAALLDCLRQEVCA